MSELDQIRANRDHLAAMIDRLDRFLTSIGVNVSYQHGAVHSAIELIRDLRAELEEVKSP